MDRFDYIINRKSIQHENVYHMYCAHRKLPSLVLVHSTC